MKTIHLKEAERVQITILVDNYTDLLLADTETAKRLRVTPPEAPLAEHGLACLISVWSGNEKHTVLMDAGISGSCLSHNGGLLASSLGVMSGAVSHRLEDVETLVLSHGHFDHFAGLPLYLKEAKGGMPLVVHPQAFNERRIRLRPELIFPMPTLKRKDLEDAGAIIDERAEASTVGGDMIMVTGKVERTTVFEKGTPGLEAFVGGRWVKDPFEDDQGLGLHLKGKGLIVLGGCSHAGIVNTVAHVRRATDIAEVYAVMGGFHLAGPSEALIDPTIAALKAINPTFVVPMHCTGWKAINRFEAQMPNAFILNSVGTTYNFSI